MSEVRKAVQKLYNTYPFPPDPLLDEPPPGYNWRWHYQSAYSFCTGIKPSQEKIRILDAGCGTGSGTEYLVLHNPYADITAIDISENALATAQKRLEKSGVLNNFQGTITFKQLPLESVDNLEGTFDLINCVGVLHHLPEPETGIKALAKKLALGGIMHIFVYGELGRWEIQLMQKAIALLQGDKRGDYVDGVKVGREIFATLPENNRLVTKEKQRWQWENQRDECFADMYVHPQEVDYNIDTLFEFINSSGLEFVGFSNPDTWQLERLIGKNPDLISRAKNLTPQQRYRLIEVLDPDNITHYEFFLTKPPLIRHNWEDNDLLNQGKPELNPCIFGWESKSLLDYQFQPITIDDEEFAFMQYCAKNPIQSLTVKDILTQVNFSLDQVRSLIKKQLIMISI
ncbi:bifunctional 2-polyprenyl-6-hydroxyphenol methylase/3-demethylubiquinol 3-O-methyltransferase UbiG [Geminocystis sp. NIES-3709]|uniref:class I SAM-dependent methyltransferase n=1 Tax=Geminocystis sp. NIES-3709 TaxID=1617448 RepID=UPI0005FC5A23|nr:class I SAM-dependent methyltransferase [Geminocystis sp. NIES-3709]BAQ66304.1 3-demethylubiquinone-9 3-methyltransferase [Geminocystis sp. NIES-3709]